MNKEVLADADWFQMRLPHFYRLYERSDKLDPDNYFKNYSALVAEECLETCFRPLDEILGKLDPKAREQLFEKALDYVVKKDPRRGHFQLFNCLNEARGYVILDERGYDEISFIDCKNQSKGSPDLLGKLKNSKAILEVKTINESEENVDRRFNNDPLQVRSARRLSDEFKGKLIKTIKCAKEKQLDAYPESVDKKIVLLLVRFDLDNLVADANFALLREWVAEIGIEYPELEIICKPVL